MKFEKLFRYYRKLGLAIHRLWRQFQSSFFKAPSQRIMISDIQVSKDERSDYTKHAFVHNKFSGILNMSERPDLLISLEKIMLKCFPTLRSSDTLASAFSLFVLQDLEEIIVLNNDESFSGIIRANVLYNEIPPGILDIPP